LRDTSNRIVLLLGVHLLFLLGQLTPLPGSNPDAWAILTRGEGSGAAAVLGLSVGSVRRVTIFALGIVPYVTAAVLMQIATMVSGTLRARARNGERGRGTIVRYARYLTLALTVLQAWGVASGLEHVRGVVASPGVLFIVST